MSNPTEKIQQSIVNSILQVEKPFKVFLFGSHAYGKPESDSDIDLLVVLDIDIPTKNFKERSENYLRISRALRDIERKVPIDLLVYTKPEFDRFIQMGSMFSKKIIKEGIEII